jgi:hypothetical protein
MHVSTDRSASHSPRRNRRSSLTKSSAQAEPAVASGLSWTEAMEMANQSGGHDPLLLLAALEEIERKQRAIASILESGLLGHCLG